MIGSFLRVGKQNDLAARVRQLFRTVGRCLRQLQQDGWRGWIEQDLRAIFMGSELPRQELRASAGKTQDAT